jgi:hypothetical protein
MTNGLSVMAAIKISAALDGNTTAVAAARSSVTIVPKAGPWSGFLQRSRGSRLSTCPMVPSESARRAETRSRPMALADDLVLISEQKWEEFLPTN